MGEVFAGRYELVDPVGRGGVGAVWRAWDHRRRRYVAAKVLRQSDAHALLRFVREQAMRIDHPHVLAPASWAADDEQVLFTMELMHGGSLSHLIGDYGPLPPHLVCVLLDQLLAGLDAVHAEGIVHRDVKPANILLAATGTGTPHVRLSDFGIAMRKGEPRLTEADFVVGTPGYFAPEQLRGAEPDFPADLYAVGLVALYLLSGRKPDAQALVDRFEATAGMPSAPLGVPQPLWQVVGTLLQPDPYARFRTATGARKALAAALPLLPEPAADEEPVEIFDQIGPLPEGFGPAGPGRPEAVPRAAEREGAGSTQGAGGLAGLPEAESAGEPERPGGPAHAAESAHEGAKSAPPGPDPHPVPPQAPYPPPGPREPTAQPEPALPVRPAPLPAVWPDAALPAQHEAVPPAQPGAVPPAQPTPADPPADPPALDPGPPHSQQADAWPPVPGPPAPWPPRPRGRHAAPPAAYEPLAHTRTRTGGPAAAPPAAAAADPPAPTQLPGTRGPSAPRPGPPARVAVTLLVLAALCFAVGIAALIAS